MAKLPAQDVARYRMFPAPMIAAALCALTLASAAQAKLYVFGDSLSDNGNIDKVTFGEEPGDDYFNGRFSNGPVWSELLGYRLGKAPGLLYYDPILTSRVDGYNFAHGGAAAVERWYLPDFLEAPGQVSYFAAQARKGRMSAKSGDIATLWIGGNDYLNYGEGSAPTVVNGVMKSLTQLDATGVGRIVLFNMPPLGEIPGEILGPNRGKLNAQARLHNSLLNKAVAAYQPQARAQITQIDVNALYLAIRRGAGGFTVTKPRDRGSLTGTCKGDGLLLNACPANYFFYDGVHPSASGQRFIASVVRDRLAAPIAAAARVALGEASALSAMTTQLGQIKTRISLAQDTPEGASAYAFGDGDAAVQNAWSQGFGADWRHDGITVGVNMIEAESETALGVDEAMSASAETSGYSAYAAWRDDGFTAALAATRLSSRQDYRRQTEIDGLPFASGTGDLIASALQVAIAQEFVSGGFAFRPEAALTWTNLEYAAFSESGTMGLSDNLYDAQSNRGTIGQAGAGLSYAASDWGASFRAYGVANLDGNASVWTASPAGVVSAAGLTPETDGSAFGAGAWAEVWLTDGDRLHLTAGGGAFTDLEKTAAAARISVRIEF